MAIVWDDQRQSSRTRTASAPSARILWDDEQSNARTRRFPGLQAIGDVIFAPARRVRSAVSGLVRRGAAEVPFAGAVGTLPLAISSTPGYREAGRYIASNYPELAGGLASAPVDPVNLALLFSGNIPSVAGRLAASAGIGGLSGLMETGDPIEAAAQAIMVGGMGGFQSPTHRAAPSRAIRPSPERLPGLSPYSFFIPAERPSIAEAEVAAREAARMAIRPTPRAAPAQARVLSERTVIWDDELTPSIGQVRPAVETPRQRLGQAMRAIPELRRQGGFVALPEEEPVKRAAGQAAARAALPRLPASETSPQLQQQVDLTAQRVQRAADTIRGLTERAEIALKEEPTVARTGTLAEEARQPFREGGPKLSTREFRFSEADIKTSQAEVVQAAREVAQLRQQAASDPLSDAALGLAEHALNDASAKFAKFRFAAGRAVKTFDFPPDLQRQLQEAGVLLGNLKPVKERLPIYTSIVEKTKRLGSLTPSERQQLTRDVIDAYRLNLFPVLSFVRDFLGNSTELATQAAEAVGRDVVRVFQGDIRVPNLQGFIRALKPKQLPKEVRAGIGAGKSGAITQQDIGVVQGAGFGKGAGTFTRRLTPGTRAVDFLVGSPLYLKGVADGAARRFGASAELWSWAIKEADRLGLKGAQRRAFYDEFWKAPPNQALTVAIREGNKAGFNRELGSLAKWWSSNRAVQLAFDAFPRWPFQFVKAAGEWLGYNPELWSAVKSGAATPEDIGGYLAKSATGWGGLWWMNQTLYDHVDWNSMEYVHDNGNRTRLSSLDPITTGLWFLSVLRGDLEASSAAVKYASIPFVRWADPDGGSGLLSSFSNILQRVEQSGKIDPKGIRREVDDWVSRAIPGQAIFSLLKVITDQTAREGPLKNIPGASLAQRPVINRATGEPLKPTQKVLGKEVPAVSGTALPGAERVLDQVTKLLSRFGLLVYRGQRSPIAGVPANEVPKEWLREWQIELGKERQRLLLRYATDPRLAKLRQGDQEYERWRKVIQEQDAKAARRALQTVRQRHPGQTLSRSLTLRERRLPEAP